MLVAHSIMQLSLQKMSSIPPFLDGKYGHCAPSTARTGATNAPSCDLQQMQTHRSNRRGLRKEKQQMRILADLALLEDLCDLQQMQTHRSKCRGLPKEKQQMQILADQTCSRMQQMHSWRPLLHSWTPNLLKNATNAFLASTTAFVDDAIRKC